MTNIWVIELLPKWSEYCLQADGQDTRNIHENTKLKLFERAICAEHLNLFMLSNKKVNLPVLN